jgi:hypothetical protein
VTLVAICRPIAPSETPQIVDIITVELRSKANRFKNAVRVINLCTLIVPLANTIGTRHVAEFVPIRRWVYGSDLSWVI